MSKRVLLIDDDVRLIGALHIRLSAAGYDVHTALNGDEGLCAAALFRPDVIISDIRMPGIDGYEVCRLLRSVPELQNIPIIVLSASVESPVAARVCEAGGNLFLRKPYDPAQLLSLLRTVIDGRQKPDASIDLPTAC